MAGKSNTSNVNFLNLTIQDIYFKLFKLSSEAVKTFWAGQQHERIYLQSNDHERASIQMAVKLLRNMLSTSSDMPLGYPIYVSPILVSKKSKILTNLFQNLQNSLVKSLKETKRKQKKRNQNFCWQNLFHKSSKHDTLEMKELKHPALKNSEAETPAQARTSNIFTRSRETLNSISNSVVTNVRQQISSLNPINRIDRARTLHQQKSTSENELFEQKLLSTVAVSAATAVTGVTPSRGLSLSGSLTHASSLNRPDNLNLKQINLESIIEQDKTDKSTEGSLDLMQETCLSVEKEHEQAVGKYQENKKMTGLEIIDEDSEKFESD